MAILVLDLDVAARMTNVAIAKTTKNTRTDEYRCAFFPCFWRTVELSFLLLFVSSVPRCCSHSVRIRSRSVLASNMDSQRDWQFNWWLRLWASSSECWARSILFRCSRSSFNLRWCSVASRSCNKVRDILKSCNSFIVWL